MSDCFKPYVCPYSIRSKKHQILLCQKLVKDDAVSELDDAVKVMCRHQFYCPIVKENINSQEAKECYEKYRAAEKDKE